MHSGNNSVFQSKGIDSKKTKEKKAGKHSCCKICAKAEKSKFGPKCETCRIVPCWLLTVRLKMFSLFVFFSFQLTVEMFDYLECELNLFLGGKLFWPVCNQLCLSQCLHTHTQEGLGLTDRCTVRNDAQKQMCHQSSTLSGTACYKAISSYILYCGPVVFVWMSHPG